jgi:hypothetical protein
MESNSMNGLYGIERGGISPPSGLYRSVARIQDDFGLNALEFVFPAEV